MRFHESEYYQGLLNGMELVINLEPHTSIQDFVHVLGQ